MKKYILFAAAIAMASASFAQCVLTYTNNALIKGDNILTKDIQFVEPGNAGPNQIWDYSKISIDGNSSSNQVLSNPTAELKGVSEYNALLNEGGREFYMNVTSDGIIEKGYTAKDIALVYSDPVLKMIYPFAFGQIFTDKYAGSASIMGISKAELAGDITVTADAFGTLILPDVTLANTLRVKTEKTGLEVNPCSSSVVRIVRYSWYAPGYRYPVLVLSTTESKTGIKEPVITKSAFLNVQQNANAVTVTSFTDPQSLAADEFAVSVYPNPFSDRFSFNYFLRKQMPVNIALYDVNGKLISIIRQADIQAEGIHTGEIEAGQLSLTPGMYYLKFTFKDKVVMKKVVKL